ILKWKGSDNDPGEAANLTYSIYMDTQGGTTLYRSNYTGTSIEISGLTDKTIYYWQVKPYDGTAEGKCISVPAVSQFSIDIGVFPRSTLKLPKNNAVVNKDSITLIWEGSGTEGETVTYDVYLSNQNFKDQYYDSLRVGIDLTVTELEVTGLIAQETYYWTVIPSNARGAGQCDDGIWSFSYNPSANSYGLDIEFTTELNLAKGKSYQEAIKITNTGDNSDIIIPRLYSEFQSSVIVLEGAGQQHNIETGTSSIYILDINTEKIPVGTFELIISVESLGGNEVYNETLTLTISEEAKAVQDKEQSYSFMIPLIILVIILIIVFQYFYNRRVKEEIEKVKADMLKPIPSTRIALPSDVEYMTGPDGKTRFVGPIQDAEIRLPGDEDYDKPSPKLPPGPEMPEEVEDEEGKVEEPLKEGEDEKAEEPKAEEPSPKELLEILETRFIQGEISEETYKELKNKYEDRLPKEETPSKIKKVKKKKVKGI
ncbi:MAG: hypothetical protein JSV49_01095, partial [Thermoplasmata archaeon]